MVLFMKSVFSCSPAGSTYSYKICLQLTSSPLNTNLALSISQFGCTRF